MTYAYSSRPAGGPRLPECHLCERLSSHIVLTEAGKAHTGVISSETTDTITLKLADLTEVRVPRKQIDELKEGTVSIMPKGLDTQLTPDELRNLRPICGRGSEP